MAFCHGFAAINSASPFCLVFSKADRILSERGFTMCVYRNGMKIERFEDIEAWQLARELTRKVYGLTKKVKFARDFRLTKQIQDAAGSSKGG